MSPEQIAHAILYVIIILAFAKVFGEIAERLGQPSVLGELIAGIVVGGSVLGLIKVDMTQPLTPDIGVLMFLAELGVILLLFEVGLESDLEEFLRVGPSALCVAVVGVIGPFVAGYLISQLFGQTNMVSIFVGATLTATSVGITARTLSDLRQLQTRTAKIILGAAVIDDILGLIILAVVSGLVVTGVVSYFAIGRTAVLAVVFLVGAIVIGIPIAPHILGLVRRLKTRGMLTVSALIFCLGLAYIGHELQLATIVGAFAAGLVLARTEDLARIQERVRPIADIFVPIFFVMLGVSVNLAVLNPLDPSARGTLALAGSLIAVAMLMKLVAGIGVLQKGVSRLVVGIGMIPRGEVGLIFASLGLSRAIISPGEYAAIIAMVVVTTFLTPPMLKVAMNMASRE